MEDIEEQKDKNRDTFKLEDEDKNKSMSLKKILLYSVLSIIILFIFFTFILGLGEQVKPNPTMEYEFTQENGKLYLHITDKGNVDKIELKGASNRTVESINTGDKFRINVEQGETVRVIAYYQDQGRVLGTYTY